MPRAKQKQLIDQAKADDPTASCYLGPFDPITVACLLDGVVTDRVREVCRRTLKDLYPTTAEEMERR